MDVITFRRATAEESTEGTLYPSTEAESEIERMSNVDFILCCPIAISENLEEQAKNQARCHGGGGGGR
jgi:hypothetical protein